MPNNWSNILRGHVRDSSVETGENDFFSKQAIKLLLIHKWNFEERVTELKLHS